MGGEMDTCAECFMNCLLIHSKDPNRSQLVSSFFKVMYGKHFSEVLIVPPRFAKTLSSLVGKSTHLKDSSGKKWKAVLSNVNGSLAFQKGWHKFSLDHGIELGDFVVFHYFKGSHFVVQIYGRSGCEKLTFSGEKGCHNKRLKTTKESIVGNGPCDSFYKEPPVEELSTACAVSEQRVDDVIQRKNDVNNVKKTQLVAGSVPSHVKITQKPKVVPTTDVLVDPCFMIDRDTSSSKEDGKGCLYDLSAFEMPPGKLVADKNSKLQLQGIIHSQTPVKLPKVESGAASTDVNKCHITEGNTSSKGFLTRREYSPSPSSCLRVDMPLGSNKPQKPIGLPPNSEFSATSGGRTRLVKQEPTELSPDFGGNAVVDTSFGDFWHNANLSSSKIEDRQVHENANLKVKIEGALDTMVNPEPVDLCDSSTAPIIKVTCLVQPDSGPFLELPERLPVKAYRQCARLEKLVFLHDPARRLWPVVYQQRYSFKVLASGWNAFQKANNIQPGDECTFVVENMDEGIVAVQIARS